MYDCIKIAIDSKLIELVAALIVVAVKPAICCLSQDVMNIIDIPQRP